MFRVRVYEDPGVVARPGRDSYRPRQARTGTPQLDCSRRPSRNVDGQQSQSAPERCGSRIRRMGMRKLLLAVSVLLVARMPVDRVRDAPISTGGMCPVLDRRRQPTSGLPSEPPARGPSSEPSTVAVPSPTAAAGVESFVADLTRAGITANRSSTCARASSRRSPPRSPTCRPGSATGMK